MVARIEESQRVISDAACRPVATHVAARLMDFARHDPAVARAMAKTLSGPQLSGMAMLHDPLSVPSSIAEKIGETIDAFPPATRRLVTIAALSVLDRADVLLAAAAVGFEGVINETLSGILTFGEGRFRFVDQRVRAVLCRRLLPGERASAHRSLARATSERDLAVVATWHAAQSRSRDARSAGALLALAEMLLSCGDVHGAWSVATSAGDDHETVGRSRLIAGRAAFASGCFDDAQSLLDQAAHLGPRAQRSLAATARDAATTLRERPEPSNDPLQHLARHLECVFAAAVTATDVRSMGEARAVIRERPNDPEEADALQARLHLTVMRSRPPWPWGLTRGPLSPLTEAFILGQYTELQLRSGDTGGAAMTLRKAARRLPMTHIGATSRLTPSGTDFDASFTEAFATPVPKRTIHSGSSDPVSVMDDWPAGLGNPALSDRQRQIARLVLDGKGNREIAEALEISPRTVEVHMGGVFRKVGVRTRGQLLARVFRAAISENP